MLPFPPDNTTLLEESMAETITHFPESQRRPTRRYPWDDWTDGQIWKLVRGEDFDAEADQFRNRLYTQAKRRGLDVRTAKQLDAEEREILIIQFYGASIAESDPDAEGFETGPE
jgi:hypothetical protein